MKGPLNLDRARHNFGVAAPAVLQILAEWEAIDWFVPPQVSGSIAESLLHEHQSLARLHLREQFSGRLTIRHRTGGWSDFVASCAEVRRHTEYDWKLGPLKDLLFRHRERHQFSLAELAPKLLVPGAAYDDRCLFIPFRNTVVWGHIGPLLDFRSLGSTVAEAAEFYFMYARGDTMQSIEWQLVEPSAPVSLNPFLPLLRLYAGGYYPFAYSPTEFTLFRFAASDS